MLSKLSASFKETQIDDEIVVMLLDSGEFLSITGTGCEIWKQIDGTSDRKALVLALASQYDASESEIATDVHTFLVRLLDAGIVAES